jgi:hypothetical protein
MAPGRLHPADRVTRSATTLRPLRPSA